MLRSRSAAPVMQGSRRLAPVMRVSRNASTGAIAHPGADAQVVQITGISTARNGDVAETVLSGTSGRRRVSQI
jgi:hypothetical protein